MDWDKGYSAEYYMAVIDPETWRDISRVEIVSGSIKKESSGLMESADVTTKDLDIDMEQWVRIWLVANSENGSAHEPLFTGLAVSPEKDIEGAFYTCNVSCYSVLKPAEDVLLDRGWYAPQGFDGVLLCEQLLSVCPAPVDHDDYNKSVNIAHSIIAEDGESNLSMVWKILNAINWRIRISGNGHIMLCPKAVEASARFSPTEYDVIEPQINVESDWFDCPNVFRAIDDDLMAVARNDSPDSPLSTVNRGREVWEEETNCDVGEMETIAEYAQRKLKELQSVTMTASYKRRYFPDLVPSDIVELDIPQHNLRGLYDVTSQSISLEYGASVDEEVASRNGVII